MTVAKLRREARTEIPDDQAALIEPPARFRRRRGQAPKHDPGYDQVT